jgi:hypothetical protein
VLARTVLRRTWRALLQRGSNAQSLMLFPSKNPSLNDGILATRCSLSVSNGTVAIFADHVGTTPGRPSRAWYCRGYQDQRTKAHCGATGPFGASDGRDSAIGGGRSCGALGI